MYQLDDKSYMEPELDPRITSEFLERFPFSTHRLTYITEINEANYVPNQVVKRVKKNCSYCKLYDVRYKSKSHVRSYYQCSGCGVALCKVNKDCFFKFHELLLKFHDVEPQNLVSYLKGKLPRHLPILDYLNF